MSRAEKIAQMLREVADKARGQKCECGGEFIVDDLRAEPGTTRCRVLVPCNECSVKLLYEAIVGPVEPAFVSKDDPDFRPAIIMRNVRPIGSDKTLGQIEDEKKGR